MTVLILSTVSDVHALAVMAALAAQGERAELLDLSEFPTQLALCMTFEEGQRRFELRRRSGGALDLGAVRAVWWRRPQSFVLPTGMCAAHRQFALSEAATAFQRDRFAANPRRPLRVLGDQPLWAVPLY